MLLFRLRLIKVPDWVRRAFRSGIALCILGTIAHGGLNQLIPAAIPPEYASEFMRLAGWAEATAILVNDSLIGMIAQTAAEQTLGTISGGMLGYVVLCVGAPFMSQAVFNVYQVAMISLIGSLSCYVAHVFDVDTPSRIFCISFFLVVNGANDPGNPLNAAILKVGTILVGVLLMQILSVVVLPRSATVDSMRCVRRAMKELLKLNACVWVVPEHVRNRNVPEQAAPVDSTTATRLGCAAIKIKSKRYNLIKETAAPHDGYVPLPTREIAQQGLWAGRDKKENERECETHLAAVFTCISKCEVNVQLSANREIYVHHGWGHYLFMPGFPGLPWLGAWLGVWRLPVTQIESAMAIIRRLAQHMWTLHMDLREGFNEEIMEAFLGQPLPLQLFEKMEGQVSCVLADLVHAFPSKRAIAVDHLLQFRAILHTMEGLSHDAKYTRLVQSIVKPEGTLQRTNSVRQSMADGLASSSGGDSSSLQRRLSGNAVVLSRVATNTSTALPQVPEECSYIFPETDPLMVPLSLFDFSAAPSSMARTISAEVGAASNKKLKSISLVACAYPEREEEEEGKPLGHRLTGGSNKGEQVVLATLEADPMDFDGKEVIEVRVDACTDEAIIPKNLLESVESLYLLPETAQDDEEGAPPESLDMRRHSPFFMACLATASADSRKMWSPPKSPPSMSPIPGEMGPPPDFLDPRPSPPQTTQDLRHPDGMPPLPPGARSPPNLHASPPCQVMPPPSDWPPASPFSFDSNNDISNTRSDTQTSFTLRPSVLARAGTANVDMWQDLGVYDLNSINTPNPNTASPGKSPHNKQTNGSTAGGLSSMLAKAFSRTSASAPKLGAEGHEGFDIEEIHVAQVRWAVLEFVIGQIGDELEELLLALAGLMARLPHPLK